MRDNLDKSNFLSVTLGVPVTLMLSFLGLLAGAELAPFFPSDNLVLVFVIPLVLNIGIGYSLMRSRLNVSAGQIILIGGTIASFALPLILL
jgi:hypothetical protein